MDDERPLCRRRTETFAEECGHRATQLPDDLWCVVSDFLPSAPLGLVCHHLHQVLCGRHVARRVSAHTLPAEVRRLRRTPQLQTLTLWTEAGGLGRGGWPPLQWLRNLSLTALTIRLRRQEVGGDVARALAALGWEVPGLTRLTYSLPDCRVGVEAAAALATLRHAPQLTTLSLDLRSNRLGSCGAAALVGLRAAPALTSLTLRLQSNGLAGPGVEELAGLATAPQLKFLTLDLEGNRLGLPGVTVLAEGLAASPSLTSLHLGLARNLLGCPGAQALLRLRRVPQLKGLVLDLQGNRIGSTGACALAALRTAPALDPSALLFPASRSQPDCQPPPRGL
eukprot:EG_transcript_13761